MPVGCAFQALLRATMFPMQGFPPKMCSQRNWGLHEEAEEDLPPAKAKT